jgi:hypothetical protein
MADAGKRSRQELISKVCPICGKCTGQPDFIGHLPVLLCSEHGLLLIDPSKSDEGRVTPITEEFLMAAKQAYSLATAARNPDFMGPVN